MIKYYKPFALTMSAPLLVALGLSLASCAAVAVGLGKPLPKDDASKLVAGAVAYALPLVVMEATRESMITDGWAESTLGPSNTINSATEYPEPENRLVVKPNRDTLYSISWFDLSREPLVLTIPDLKGRYHMMPVFDMWTNVIASPGSRTLGDGPHTVVFTGPGWDGDLGIEVSARYACSTRHAWMLGRTYAVPGDDTQAALQFMRQYRLQTLSDYKASRVPEPPRQPTEDELRAHLDRKSPYDVVRDMSAEDFFTRFNELLADAPPYPEDKAVLEKFALIGVGPGLTYNPKLLARIDVDAVKAETMRQLLGYAGGTADDEGPPPAWNILLEGVGDYGTDYAMRAVIASVGLGANQPADSVYPSTNRDATSARLDGSRGASYRIRFAADQLPPVQGFWSLTLYDKDEYLYPNSAERYLFRGTDELHLGDDGSLTLVIQHEEPEDPRVNWLPAPADLFNLTLRLYWPREAVLDGRWTPPPVEKVR